MAQTYLKVVLIRNLVISLAYSSSNFLACIGNFVVSHFSTSN